VNINLHIERLVLDGIAIKPHQRAELKVAMESELNRLLTLNGIDQSEQSSKDFRVAQGDWISIESNNDPSHLGQQVAEAVYKGIKK